MDKTALKQALQSGLDELNYTLNKQQIDNLLLYIELLSKWNSTYNLTAVRTPDAMLSHHILDSLTLLSVLENISGSLIDVGSGGGMPGIPVAIARPDLHITLLDANSKKTTFLQQAIIELKLSHVQVQTARVEALNGQTFDVVTSRAFSELDDFVRVTRQLCQNNGFWAAMKGIYPYEEIASLDKEIEVKEVKTVHVPQLDAQRHIVLMTLKK